MVIGEIVETLIRVRDGHSLTWAEDEAVCAACNILDKLPRMMDEGTAQETLRQLTKDYEAVKAALADAEATLTALEGACGQFCDEAIAGYQERRKARENGRKTA